MMRLFKNGIGQNILNLDIDSRSTAKKIIKGIRQKFIDSITKQDYEWLHRDHLSHVIWDQDTVVKTLGKAIDEAINYPAYQKLTGIDKGKVRKLIINKLYDKANEYRPKSFGFSFAENSYNEWLRYSTGFVLPEDLFYSGNELKLKSYITDAIKDDFHSILIATPTITIGNQL